MCLGSNFQEPPRITRKTQSPPLIQVGQKLGVEDVIQTLTTISTHRGVPKHIFCDNGSEFHGRLVDMWAYQNQVSLEFSRPGKPTDNAHILASMLGI